MAICSDGAISAGLILGAASILSVGPNSQMIIRAGLCRSRPLTVASTVWISDIVLAAAALLIASEVAGVDPRLQYGLSWFGLAVIGGFAGKAFLTSARGRTPTSLRPRIETGPQSVRRALLFVWCNPLTYLERMLIPAGLLQSLGTTDARLHCLAALLAMAAFCRFGYASGGWLCASLLRGPRGLQAFDFVAGCLLTGMGGSLAIRLVGLA